MLLDLRGRDSYALFSMQMISVYVYLLFYLWPGIAGKCFPFWPPMKVVELS